MARPLEVFQQEPLVYTVREAMHLTRIGRTKFYALIASGKLRTKKIGHSYFIPKTELERFLSLPDKEAE